MDGKFCFNRKGSVMKIQPISVFGETAPVLSLIVLLCSATTVQATTHVVQFGGSFGITYSPNSLSVSVGDTLKWEGDFGVHPLSSTSVPAGALNFLQSSGSVFSYVVTVAGTYQYQCDVHFSLGMVGSFTASPATGIENGRISFRPDAFSLKQNYPNPLNPSTVISYQIATTSYVTLKVYNVLGEEVAALVDETEEPGEYSVRFDGSKLPSGVYFYRMNAGNFNAVEKLVLLK